MKGRILALDMGEKRHGVALSDPTRLLARSYTVLPRRSRREDFERLQAIAQEQKVTLLLVGLPLPQDGQETAKTAWVRDYAAALADHTGLPLAFWDERYSTVQAEDSLRERNIHGRKRRQQVDATAAAFILQAYLDAHHE